MREDKSELIEELSDILDSLSPKEAYAIFSKLSITDLLKLKMAIEDAINTAVSDGDK